MGARERARLRQSKGSKGESSPWGSQQKSHTSHKGSLQASQTDGPARAEVHQGWQDYASSPTQNSSSFSLRNEARNTRHGDWFNTRLRDNKITFVSAGTLVREDPPTVQNEEPLVPDVEKDFQQNNQIEAGPTNDPVKQEPVLPKTIDEQVKLLDISGESAESDHSSQRQRKTSVSSVQSDELIVFAGRKGISQTTKPSSGNPATTNSVNTTSVVPAEAATLTKVFENRLETKANPSSWNEGAPNWVEEKSIPNHKSFTKAISKKRTRGSRHARRQETTDDEEALLQDYIENMAVDDDDDDEEEAQATGPKPHVKTETFRFFDGQGDENAKVRSIKTKGKTPKVTIDALVWDSENLQDFDPLSTTDEDVTEITQILRQRRRPTGLQFLVTALGDNTRGAQWVPEEKMTSVTAREELRIWREIRTIQEHDHHNSDDSDESSESDSEEALGDLIGNIESEDDENARILERTSKMTDSMIARALQKQEDLGLGGDEIVLFDGQEHHHEADEFEAGDGFVPFSVQAHTSNRLRSKRNKRAKDTFPSASAFADALDEDPYGAFDIMDFDRPSLRPKKKGRKGELPVELQEENEFEAELRQQWQTDRQKKATRKQEREAARMAGLLGTASRGGPPDLHTKYANSGMDSSQIKDEIRTFLVQEEFESLSLASMDASMRASVHRLAKALNLASKSHGSGDNRHPILTKTARTAHYTPQNIWEIDALMSLRKFFPRPGGFGSSNKNPKSTAKIRKGGGGGVLAGASYMDGDVVGASAPELGVDNKGYGLLQKMGWQSGQAIGAVGNKGSVEVIKHVVKNTKAGLG